MTTPARTWDESLTAAADFVATNGRFPAAVSGTLEGSLRNWIVTQRRTASPERTVILDEKLPGWRGTVARRPWAESLALTVAYVTQHGKNPAQTHPDHEVARLAHWLKDQRANASREEADALDAAVPGWRGTHPGHRSWDESFALVCAFSERHGRLPKKSPGEEGRIGTWLDDQRGRANDSQRARLTAEFPGWDAPAYSFEESLEAVKAFHADNGRLPRQCDHGQAGELGYWVSHMRQTANPGRRAILDAAFPGWHVTRETQWTSTLNGYASFVASRGRLPSAAATDAGEVSLARWMEKQRRHASGDRVVRLDAAVPGWRGSGARGRRAAHSGM